MRILANEFAKGIFRNTKFGFKPNEWSSYIVEIPALCAFALLMFGATVASVMLVKCSKKYKCISYLV